MKYTNIPQCNTIKSILVESIVNKKFHFHCLKVSVKDSEELLANISLYY